MSSSQVPSDAGPAPSRPQTGRGAARAPRSGNGGAAQDIRWVAVWTGFAVAALITILAGVPMLAARDSTWLLAAVGSVGLFVGGLLTGRRVWPRPPLLNGALLAVVYNLTVVVAFFIGSFLEILHEPLPGLPQGDSTFFFAWPLAQFVLATAGAAIGGRMSVKRKMEE